MSEKEEYKRGENPRSLANLRKPWDTDSAKAAQLKGAAVRKANRIARDQLKMSLNTWKQLREEVQEDFSSVELLRVIAMQKMEEGDFDGATEILKSIAEFEKPKLARVEQQVENVGADEMSDEELAAAIKKLSEE